MLRFSGRNRVELAAESVVSIVIPVCNEEEILESAVVELKERLIQLGWRFELLLSENGSTDRTREILKNLVSGQESLRGLTENAPNYGLALRKGIEEASGTHVICDEIDVCDVDFHTRALELLNGDRADLVIGSKQHAESFDLRPWTRRLATRMVNLILRVVLGYRGTDTHGLKAFHRETLLPVVRKCRMDKDIFASELVLRVERMGLRVVEIPVQIEEQRPARIPLVRRVPRVLWQIFRLFLVIRLDKTATK
jgi:glycosyltransferase involved in cell wall biosynthesis